MNEATAELDPELGDVVAARPEIGKDPVHDGDAFGRVAMLHLASEDGAAAGEDAVRAFGEETDAVLGVHEGQIHGERGKDGGQLLEGEVAGGKLDGIGAGEPEGFAQDGLGRAVALLRLEEAPAVAGRGGPDFGPVLLGEGLLAHRQQDVLLLVDHLFEGGEGGLGDGGGDQLPFACRHVFLFQGLAEILEQGADLVVLGPHDLGGAGDAVALEVREKDVLFALVMLFDVHEFVEGLAPAQERLAGVGLIGQAPDVGDGEAHAEDGGAQGFVFAAQGVGGVARRDGSGRRRDQHFPGQLGVQVAHALDLLDGHAFGHELLFHGHDLGVVGPAHEFPELVADLIRRRAGVEFPDDFLQRAHPVGAVVYEFAHEAAPRLRAYQGRGSETMTCVTALQTSTVTVVSVRATGR